MAQSLDFTGRKEKTLNSIKLKKLQRYDKRYDCTQLNHNKVPRLKPLNTMDATLLHYFTKEWHF